MNELKKVTIKIGNLFSKLGLDNVYEQEQFVDGQIFIKTPDDTLAKINAFVKKKDNKIIEVKLKSGIVFKCSENHLIQNEYGITSKVKDSNFLCTKDGIDTIISKEYICNDDVYDIALPFPHLYITPNGVIHHNTFLALEAARNAQKAGYFVILYDSEMANNDKQALIQRGLDIENLLYIPVDTVENLKTSLLNIIDEATSDDKLFIVVDSIGNLSTKKELEDSTDGSTTKDMTRPAQLKALFRTVTIKAGIKNVAIIAINHVYAAMNSMFPSSVISGGNGGMYNSSIITEFTKAQEKGADGKMSGALVSSTVSKCRTAKERTKVKFTIDFEEGLSLYSGLQLFCDDEKIFLKEGRSFKLNPAMCAGVELKVGPVFSSAKMSPAFWEEFLEKYLADYLREKFRYKSISEELNISEDEQEELEEDQDNQ